MYIVKYADYLLLCHVYYSRDINPLKGCLSLKLLILLLLICCQLQPKSGYNLLLQLIFAIMFYPQSFSGSCILASEGRLAFWLGRADWHCCLICFAFVPTGKTWNLGYQMHVVFTAAWRSARWQATSILLQESESLCTAWVEWVEGSWLPITSAASANQNLANNILPKRFFLVPHMFASQAKALQQSGRLFEPNITSQVSSSSHSLMVGGISCNEMGQIKFIWLLGSDSNRHTPPVNTVPHGHQVKSWCESIGGRA